MVNDQIGYQHIKYRHYNLGLNDGMHSQDLAPHRIMHWISRKYVPCLKRLINQAGIGIVSAQCIRIQRCAHHSDIISGVHCRILITYHDQTLNQNHQSHKKEKQAVSLDSASHFLYLPKPLFPKSNHRKDNKRRQQNGPDRAQNMQRRPGKDHRNRRNLKQRKIQYIPQNQGQ